MEKIKNKKKFIYYILSIVFIFVAISANKILADVPSFPTSIERTCVNNNTATCATFSRTWVQSVDDFPYNGGIGPEDWPAAVHYDISASCSRTDMATFATSTTWRYLNIKDFVNEGIPPYCVILSTEYVTGGGNMKSAYPCGPSTVLGFIVGATTGLPTSYVNYWRDPNVVPFASTTTRLPLNSSLINTFYGSSKTLGTDTGIQCIKQGGVSGTLKITGYLIYNHKTASGGSGEFGGAPQAGEPGIDMYNYSCY